MALEFTTSYLADSITLLLYYKKLGEQAMAQVSDEGLTATLDAESNSIAIIVKHLTRNMRSALDGFSYVGRRKARSQSRRRVPRRRPKHAPKSWRLGSRPGRLFLKRSRL